MVTLHLEARGTDAAEGTLKVLASAWQAGSREAETLVGVHAVLPIICELKAILAEAMEGASCVEALAKSAYLPCHGGAFIHVHAIATVCCHEAGEAEAVVGANNVLAGPVSTRLPVTLVDIRAQGLVC